MGAPDYLRVLFSFVAVIGLIGALAVLGPRLGARLRTLTGKVGLQRPASRLAIAESLSIDPKRRVMIIQCDDHEHLVLISATGETVIASPLAREKREDSSQTVHNESTTTRPSFASLVAKTAA
ncbi:MAG: flagellar biosynthetic protein FliO [Pseudomonadota bacterium]